MPFDDADNYLALENIGSFLRANPAAYCYQCIGAGTGLKNVSDLLKPRRDTPFSFSTGYCYTCHEWTWVVAYVGEAT